MMLQRSTAKIYQTMMHVTLKPVNVLLIEDDPENARLIQVMLSQEKFSSIALTWVTDLQSGLTHLSHNNGSTHAILLDLMLPDSDGLATYARICQQAPHIPVVVLSAIDDEVIAIQAIQAGAQDYLVKNGLESNLVVRALKYAIERKQTEAVLQKTRAEQEQRIAERTADLSQANAALKREVAERKQVEEALRESEERFRQFITSISDHIYVTRITPGGERKNLYISPNVETLTGYPRQTFVDNWSYWASVVIHPNDRDIAARQAELLARGESSEMEYRIIRADGLEIWVRDSARVEQYHPASQSGMVYGVVSNITSRKRAELENARLHAQTQSRARALAILNKAGQTITSTLDLNTVLEQVLNQVQMFFEAEGASILLFNPVRNKLVFEAVSADDANLFLGKSLQLEDGIAGWVLKNKEAVVLDNAHQDSRFYNRIDALTGNTTRSIIAIPMIFKDQAIGVVEVINKASGTFNQHDLEILEALTGSAAVAVANARLYDEIERNTQQLTVLHELDQAITTSLRLSDVFHAFFSHAARLLPYDHMLIAMIEGDNIRVAYEAGSSDAIFSVGATFSRDSSAMGWVIARGQPLLRNNIAHDTRFSESSHLFDAGIQSTVTLPLRVNGQTIGTWNLGSKKIGAYQVSDLNISQSMADQLAIAVENARLFEQVQIASEQRRQLAQQVVAAQEEERQRLSYELHDESGQTLTALKLWLQLIQEDLPQKDNTLYQRLDEAIDLTSNLMEQLRAMARDLRPPVLNVARLNDALQDHCLDFAKRTRLNINYSGIELTTLSDAAMICLYRFLQESLTNVAKHAQATQVQVKLSLAGQMVNLSIQDNGHGFYQEVDQAISNQLSGIGLLGVRERLELLNGRLDVESQPGQGTRLTAHLPLEAR